MSRTQHVGRAAFSATKTPFAVLRDQWQALGKNTKPTLRDLINAESALGRTLFGPIPTGHQREFFTAQRNVWIWHERWLNAAGLPEEMTIRYEVHPHGVYKRATGQGSYQKIEGEELENFRHATQAYLEIIKRQLYN